MLISDYFYLLSSVLYAQYSLLLKSTLNSKVSFKKIYLHTSQSRDRDQVLIITSSSSSGSGSFKDSGLGTNSFSGTGSGLNPQHQASVRGKSGFFDRILDRMYTYQTAPVIINSRGTAPGSLSAFIFRIIRTIPIAIIRTGVCGCIHGFLLISVFIDGSSRFIQPGLIREW